MENHRWQIKSHNAINDHSRYKLSVYNDIPFIVEPNLFHSASDGALRRVLTRANAGNDHDKEATGTSTNHISGDESFFMSSLF